MISGFLTLVFAPKFSVRLMYCIESDLPCGEPVGGGVMKTSHHSGQGLKGNFLLVINLCHGLALVGVDLDADELTSLTLADPASELVLNASDINLALVSRTLRIVASVVLEENSCIFIAILLHYLVFLFVCFSSILFWLKKVLGDVHQSVVAFFCQFLLLIILLCVHQ